MGKVAGFLGNRPAGAQIIAASIYPAFSQFTLPMSQRRSAGRAAWIAAFRCTHGPTGCPIHSQIPDWDGLVYNGDWDSHCGDPQSALGNNFRSSTEPHLSGALRGCTLNLGEHFNSPSDRG